MNKKENVIVIGSEEYLNLRQLSNREGFSVDGMVYRLKKLGVSGVKFDFTPRTLFNVKEIERLEKEGKFVKLR